MWTESVFRWREIQWHTQQQHGFNAFGNSMTSTLRVLPFGIGSVHHADRQIYVGEWGEWVSESVSEWVKEWVKEGATEGVSEWMSEWVLEGASVWGVSMWRSECSCSMVNAHLLVVLYVFIVVIHAIVVIAIVVVIVFAGLWFFLLLWPLLSVLLLVFLVSVGL